VFKELSSENSIAELCRR